MSQIPALCKQETDVLFDLNNRLAVYMGKVRSLEAEISHIKYSKVNVISLTRTAELQYEDELKETRKRIAAIAKEKATLQIDVSKWKDEAEDWKKKCGSLETRRTEAVNYWKETYANLEAELRALEKAHETCKKNLVVERQNVDELKWQIQSLEQKLERMENIHQEVTTQIREEYEAKLEVVVHKAQTEYEERLRELREKSELKIRKARKNIELVLEQKRAAHRARIEGLETELEECLLKLRDREYCNLHLESELLTYRTLLESEESRLKHLEYRVSGSSSREITNGQGNVSVEVDTSGKYIKLYNKTDEAMGIGGWQLRHQAGDKEEMVYRFEGNLQLLPRATITVWSSDSGQVHSPPGNLVMINQSWDTDGDLRTSLLKEDGKLVAYTAKAAGYAHTEPILGPGGIHPHYQEVLGSSSEVLTYTQ